jgi:HlyD family secretion protein
MSEENKEQQIRIESANDAYRGDSEILESATNENSAIEIDETNEKETSPRKKALIIGGIVAATFLLIFAYLYLERQKQADVITATTANEKTEVVVSVKVAKAEKQQIAKDVTALGTVAPLEQSNVSASISAQIKQMRLLKNQYVRQGEVLAVLASQDLQAQRTEAQTALEEAQLNLQTLQKVTIPQTAAQNQKDLADAKAIADNAQATYERRKDLYAKGGLSLKELEASQLVLQNAENALRLAQQNTTLNRTAVNPNARAIAESKIKQARDRVNTIDVQRSLAEVRAPISGVVTEQFQFEGEFAAQGAKLFIISNAGEVIVKANFADTIVANLRQGDAVTIYLPYAPDERMGGKITLISRSSDLQNRTVEVWANFANGRGLLRAGDSVQFVVSANPTADAIVIPLAAVTLDATNSDVGTVMMVDADSVAHETKVKIGIKNGDLVQITEGLEEGATVVVEGNYALPDGTKVEVAKDEEATADAAKDTGK